QLRLDPLTGLLNARGVMEELYAYRDEYALRKVDFARIHVNIEDFEEVNRQFGYDFGDSVIRAVSEALLHCVGKTASVGRPSGGLFVVLAQFHEKAELEQQVQRIRRIPTDLKTVDGISFSLFLTVGESLYSETESTEAQADQARLRMLTNRGRSASTQQLRENMRQIFRMYDTLPIAYAVYQMLPVKTAQPGVSKCAEEAVILYANQKFREGIHWQQSDPAGKQVSEVFPMINPEWYHFGCRAAMQGETIEERVYYPLLDKYLRITVSQVIGEGFCAFTFQEENDVTKEEPADAAGQNQEQL
ncbi:MAG: GGDEF domain-containing protein, partial [Oscillibacter sp.]|nr:GGDEF domain-containing protein [Oscillibacter sp.]